jgi:hypothetical protein
METPTCYLLLDKRYGMFFSKVCYDRLKGAGRTRAFRRQCIQAFRIAGYADHGAAMLQYQCFRRFTAHALAGSGYYD